MKARFRCTAAAIALIAATCTILPVSSEVLTLDQAVSTAESNNRLLKNARIEIGKAQHEVEVTKTKGLPDLVVTAEGSQMLMPVKFDFNKGVFGSFPGIGPVPAVDTTISAPQTFSLMANVTLLQPITQMHRVSLGVRMQKAGVEIARESWRSQKQILVSNVKQLYYGLAQLGSAKKTVGESIAFLTELEHFVSDNVKQGTVLESDLLEVQARLAKQRHQETSLSNTMASTRERLNVAMGRDVSSEFDIASVPAAVLPSMSLAELRDRAVKSRPEIRQSSLKVQIAQDDERSKKSEERPDLSLAVTYTRFQNIEVIPDQLLTAGVVATWKEPFDWGRRKNEREEKARAVEQASNGLDEAISEVSADVNARFRELQDSLSLMEADEAAVKAKEEKRRVTMNRYKENASLLKDILQADTELADANRQLIEDQMAAATARAKLDQAIGED